MFEEEDLKKFRDNLKVGDTVAYLPALYEGFEVVDVYEENGETMLKLGAGDGWEASRAFPCHRVDIPPLLHIYLDVTASNIVTTFSGQRLQRNIPTDEEELKLSDEEHVDRYNRLAGDCVKRFNVILETGAHVTQDTLEDMIDDTITDLVEMKWRMALAQVNAIPIDTGEPNQ